MLISELNFNNLCDFLRPILRKQSREDIHDAGASILNFSPCLEGEVRRHCEIKPTLRYRNYDITVCLLCYYEGYGIAAHLTFRAKPKIWNLFPNAGLVSDLKRACILSMGHLKFEKCDHDNKYGKVTAYCDRRAINPEWDRSLDMSPLAICPSENDRYCYVELFFWGGAYKLLDGEVVPRSDWKQFCDYNKLLRV